MIVGADEKGAEDVSGHDFTVPTVVLVGNEARGLGQAYQKMCDALVQIPMTGSATSLNVSMAASIILYEAGRQRRGTSASLTRKLPCVVVRRCGVTLWCQTDSACSFKRFFTFRAYCCSR